MRKGEINIKKLVKIKKVKKLSVNVIEMLELEMLVLEMLELKKRELRKARKKIKGGLLKYLVIWFHLCMVDPLFLFMFLCFLC